MTPIGNSKQLLGTNFLFCPDLVADSPCIKLLLINLFTLPVIYTIYNFIGFWFPSPREKFNIFNKCFLGNNGMAVGITAVLIVDRKTN